MKKTAKAKEMLRDEMQQKIPKTKKNENLEIIIWHGSNVHGEYCSIIA